MIFKELNVYQTIKQADFHATVYSTCAIEAPALGVPNLLINIEEIAKKHYSDLLTNLDVTQFIETEREFVDRILNWQPKSKKEIMKLHNGFYKQNHRKSLRNALDIIQKRTT